MTFFSTSIRARLIGSFAVFVVLLALVCSGAAWRLAELSTATHEIATFDLRMERLIGEWLANTKSNVVRATVLTHSDDADLRRLLGPQMERTSQRINAVQREIEAALNGPQARELFARIGQRRSAYLEARATVLARKKAGDPQAADLLTSTVVPAAQTYIASIEALEAHFRTEVEGEVQRTEAIASNGRTALMATGAAGVLLAALFAWWIARSVTRPIAEALRTARAVAAGDLTVTIDASQRDEMGQMLQALADMTERLRDLVSAVAVEARTVAETSAQIAQGNSDLAQRTEEQATTLEETASAMEELTTTVGQNAEHARQAATLSAAATESARAGGEVVDQVVRTMDEISGASQRIGDIIGVIDGIAFQTNILALNAAVEAARAGEQGRGFAVVAGEVRNLAQRSAAASREIRGLIGESVRTVSAGSQLADEAGRKMVDVLLSARKVSSLMTEIAQASQEQNAGIEQVNTAVIQMEQGVQQNASMVEEAAAATESLKGKAQELLRMMSVFRLPASGASRPVAASPRSIAHEVPASAGGSSLGALLPLVPKQVATAASTGPGWREF